MADESLRARLESLNRGPLPTANTTRKRASPTAVRSPTPTTLPSGQKKSDTVSALKIDKSPATPDTCNGLLRSGEIVETAAGPHLQIELPLERLWPSGTNLLGARQAFLQSQLMPTAAAIGPRVAIEPEFASFVAALPDRVLALDLETCGLAGSALFLAGVLRQSGGRHRVQLLVARSYAEEAAVLASFWAIAAEHDVLLTFNGKAFDWPMIVERSVRHRLPLHSEPDRWSHIDVLHHARRKWRKHLPDCRLLTLERHVCRRKRQADIPGHEIPGVYADFVRTGFEREMDRVLFHNALDLVTLVDLAHRLAA